MNELDEMLAQLGAELDTPLPEIEIPVVEATGTTKDQMVRVTVSGGEVTAVTIDPRSMRKSSAELGDDIRTAVNAAFVAHGQALMARMQSEATDPASLRTELDSVRDQAVKSLNDYMEQMTRMMEAAAARQESAR